MSKTKQLDLQSTIIENRKPKKSFWVCRIKREVCTMKICCYECDKIDCRMKCFRNPISCGDSHIHTTKV